MPTDIIAVSVEDINYCFFYLFYFYINLWFYVHQLVAGFSFYYNWFIFNVKFI